MRRKAEGGGIRLEGATGEIIHLGQETSEKRKACHQDVMMDCTGASVSKRLAAIYADISVA